MQSYDARGEGGGSARLKKEKGGSEKGGRINEFKFYPR